MKKYLIGILVISSIQPAFSQITFVETDLNSTTLNALRGMAVSPDGKHVYGAAASSDAIVWFDRNDADGKLTFKSSVTLALELDNVYSIAISSDGKNVYGVSRNDDYITVWDRNSTTGALTLNSALLNGTNSITNMGTPYQVVISPDDKNIYVSANDDEAIVVFDRNASTGVLTFNEAKTAVTDLTEPRFMAFSPNGDNMYVTGSVSNSLIVFDRNTSTGDLTFNESHTDGNGGINLLELPHGVACSPDGKYVYVGSRGNDALLYFTRNLSTGDLTFANEYGNNTGTPTITDFADPQAIAIQSDSDEMYIASGTSDAVHVFSINTSTGVPTFVEKHNDGVSGVTSGALNNVHNVLIGPAGKQVYFGSQAGDGITTFSVDNPPVSAPTSATVAATAFLEGAYNGTDLNKTINASIPLTQPYSINGHSGGTAVSIPANAVDWVLVELRESGSAAAALNSTKVGSAAGFLMNDGTIKATDGTSDLTVSLSGNSGSDFYVVIYHRNHLPIMSATAISESSSKYTIDFTSASANTYQTTTALVSLSGGKFGMPAGDGDADGDIDATDLSTWRTRNGAAFNYSSNGTSDFNLDGVINAIDRNLFHKKNTSKSRQVPTT